MIETDRDFFGVNVALGVAVKKLINDPHDVVVESLEGFQLAYPTLVKVHYEPNWVERFRPKAKGKVAVISGGGAGHDPLHTGYVGLGMLDAAVPGPVFTSPTPDPIVAATKAVERGGGAVYIVKNYTGDVLNFEIAAEFVEAEGLTVETILVNDDCAVEDSLYTAGRRGVAGTVLVEKIAGAAAERGDDLQAVAKIGRRVNERMRSMGLALSACTVPYAGVPSFELADDEVEMGIGIHGEPGYRRGHMENADKLTTELYERVRDDLGIKEGDSVIVVVNGMGGTPESELFIVFRKLTKLLAADGIRVVRQMVGNFVTSLEMEGVSITLLAADNEIIQLFDEPVRTPSMTAF